MSSTSEAWRTQEISYAGSNPPHATECTPHAPREEVRVSFVSELANDSISYVPTPEAYPQGGYEIQSSNLAPDAGKTLVDAAIGLLEGLR